MLWFYQNVKQDAPMDYKNPIIWKKALPGLPYPEEDKCTKYLVMISARLIWAIKITRSLPKNA